MTAYDTLCASLRQSPRRWLVTGVAGFIGSNLLETLLNLDQHVIGLDNLATGHLRNLDLVRDAVGDDRAARFTFIEGDIRDLDACRRACADAELVLHQAALGSVPRSIADPLTTHQVNTDGFVNMLIAAREAAVSRFVYASSSSVYGDAPGLPKSEETLGDVLSPYAATKLCNEVYATAFSKAYGIGCVGLRYFNVFGPRQDPEGAYAAVMPRWIDTLLSGEQCLIFGDGETSRDFCYVANAVQANLLAATSDHPEATNRAYNIAYGQRTTLNELFTAIRDRLAHARPALADARARHEDFRPGDIRHSLADISSAQQRLGYTPTHDVDRGLEEALQWYLDDARARGARGA